MQANSNKRSLIKKAGYMITVQSLLVSNQEV